MTRSATNNRNNIRKVLAGKRARTCKNQRGGKQPLSSLLGTTHSIECKIVKRDGVSSEDGVKFSPGKATSTSTSSTSTSTSSTSSTSSTTAAADKDVSGNEAEKKAKIFKYYLLLFISYYNADAKFHKGSNVYGGYDGGEYKVITDIKQALFGGTRASTNVLYSSYRSTSVNRAITSMVTGLNNIELYTRLFNNKDTFFYLYQGSDNYIYVGIHNDKSLEPFNDLIEEAKRMQKSEILNKDKTIFYKKKEQNIKKNFKKVVQRGEACLRMILMRKAHFVFWEN